jgi:hypothetical protein
MNANDESALTPDRILALVAQDFRAWPRLVGPIVSGGAGYDVRIAEDAEAALGLLLETPGAGGRLILRWDGDAPFGGAVPEAEIAVHTLAMILTRAESMRPDPSATALDGSLPFLRLVGDVRARVLSYRGSGRSADRAFRYKGTRSIVAPDSLPLAAWEMTFSIRAAVPVNAAGVVPLDF